MNDYRNGIFFTCSACGRKQTVIPNFNGKKGVEDALDIVRTCCGWSVERNERTGRFVAHCEECKGVADYAQAG